MNSIFIRRSVRSFDESKRVSNEQIEQLLRAAMQAPSAKNEQPWAFIVVDDKSLINAYALEVGNQRITQASHFIVIVTDLSLVTTPLYIQDVSASMQNILLEAVELGLGGCWLGVYPREERMNAIKKVLNIPEGIEPFGIAAIGYPQDAKANYFIDRYQSSRIHYNKW
jgi:nitroreductase